MITKVSYPLSVTEVPCSKDNQKNIFLPLWQTLAHETFWAQTKTEDTYLFTDAASRSCILPWNFCVLNFLILTSEFSNYPLIFLLALLCKDNAPRNVLLVVLWYCVQTFCCRLNFCVVIHLFPKNHLGNTFPTDFGIRNILGMCLESWAKMFTHFNYFFRL